VIQGCGGIVVGSAAPVKTSSATSNAATVVVKAAKEVKILVNGQETTRRSDEDSYQSPALEAGQTYSYEVKAELVKDGKTLSKTKTITVRAGRETVVDFSDLGSESKAVAEAAEEAASVTVIAPEGTKVLVNDVAFTISGKRTFDTPKLQKGQKYFYTVKAEVVRDGKNMTETRRVDVEAGKSATVDFNKAESALTASR